MKKSDHAKALERFSELIPDQEMLQKGSTERIETAFLKGRRKHLKSPVVLVFNLLDSAALEVMQRQGLSREAEQLKQRSLGQQYTPTCYVYVPLQDVENWLPTGHENIRDVIATRSETFDTGEFFPVVLIGRELVSVLPFPTPPMESGCDD